MSYPDSASQVISKDPDGCTGFCSKLFGCAVQQADPLGMVFGLWRKA